MPIAGLLRMIEQSRQEIRSVDAVSEPESAMPQQPDQWHAVRENEPGGVMGPPDRLVPHRFHDTVDAGQRRVVPTSVPHPTVDFTDRDGYIYRADLYAEN